MNRSRRAFALGLGVAALGCRGPRRARGAIRVVSTIPSTTEALFAIGAGSLVVGRSRYCDFPPEARALPAIGGFADPSLEAILALTPTLVVGGRGPAGAAWVEKLAAHGIDTYFPLADSIADVDAMIVELGARTHHEGEAAALVRRIAARRDEVIASVRGRRAPRVLFVFGVTPIVVAGPGTFADEMLRLAGGINVTSTAGLPQWPTIDLEKVIALDPDIVLDAAVEEHHGNEHLGAPWSAVRAVREGHVVPLAGEVVLRPGPRIAEGLAQIARALHPGANVPAEAR